MRAQARPAGATVARLPALRPVADLRTERATALGVAAALSLAAAWVHLAYVAPHLRQWWAYGAFFIAAGAGQAVFAPLVLRRPRPWVILAGIAGNVAIVGMYVVSRTAGPPLGPHAHVAERAGTIDLATTAAEIVLVAILVTMLGARMRRVVLDALLVNGVLLWVLRLTGRLP
jgi:hypothetical protein